MSISYTLRESLTGFNRNRSSSLITVFTVGISLLLLGVFTIITVNFTSLVRQIRSRVDVEVFLVEGLGDEHIRELKMYLLAIPGVEDAEFVSKEDAAKIFEQDYGETFGDILDDNPLPVSYHLQIREGYNNSDSVRAIADRVEKMQPVESVYYRKQLLQLIDSRARAFGYATLFIGLILALSAVILVANTIRLTIYAKREIIRTMKLVGATPMFIRMPFLIEGVFHGFVGGILASVLIDIVFTFFIQPLSEDLLFNIGVDMSFYMLLIVAGGVLGFFGSMISIHRFLKESIVLPV